MKKIEQKHEKSTFDWHKWKASIYEEPEDILRAFNELNVCGKQITGIDVIGFASQYDVQYAARCAQHNAGIPYEIIDNGEFIYSDQILIPCSIEINEPIIFTFKDGSTFELQAKDNNSLKMSSNQLNNICLNGTNYNNINANMIFNQLIGMTIRSLSVQNFIKEIFDSERQSKSVAEFRRYQFWTSRTSDYGFSITHHRWAWYTLDLRNQKHFMFEGNEIEKIPYAIFIDSFKKKRQILIIEGHDGTSYFWINPVKILSNPDKHGEYIEEHSIEEISIEEDNVSEFLYYFLEKYFHHEIQIRDWNNKCEFEWNLEHNLYTYDAVKNIISEIQEISALFCTDFDNKKLDEIKKRFSPYTFSDDDINTPLVELSNNDKNEIYKENIELVLDFYERFCLRMELMMLHSPQCNLVSFMGP